MALGGVGTAAAISGAAGATGGLTSTGVLAGTGIAAGAAGGVLGAIGSLFSGKSQQSLYNYQAGIAQQNAALAKQDSSYALSAGEVETQQAGMRTRAEIGETKAGFGASNVDVNSGSSSRVISSETQIGQENEAVTSANATKRAYGFGVKAAMDTAQGSVYSSAASTSSTAGELGAATSLISAMGSVSSKWLQFGQSFGSTNPNSGNVGNSLGGQLAAQYNG